MSVHDLWDGARSGVGKRFEVRWRSAGRQQKRRFDTARAAREFDARQKLDPDSRVIQEGRSLTVDALMATWLETKAALPGLKTQDVYRTDQREVLLTFAGRYAAQVKPSEVDVWVNRVRGQSLRERSLRAMRQAYKIAIRDGLLKVDPTAGIAKPRANKPDPTFLTWAELARLAEAAGDDPLIWLLGTSGLRLGEAIGLKVGDVRGNRLRVSRQVTSTSQGQREGPPKHGKPRDVPLPAFIVAMLPTEGRPADEWLFPNSHGGPHDQHNWRARVFKPAAVKAGIPDAHPHSLRHTAASLAIDSGADVGGVQQMLGHKNASMTLDLYRHLYKDHLDEVAQRMDEARARLN